MNPLPIVSSLLSHADDGYSSLQVLSGCLTSTPVAFGSAGSQNSSHNQHNTTPRCRPQIENPPVRVGLIPQDLADIFLSPQTDERDKRPSRHITGVQVLTSNEYVEMMREKDRKEKEASEMKQQRKEERERNKMEKEKERERKKVERGGRRVEGRESVPSSVLQVKTNMRSTSTNQRAAVHIQSVFQRDIERAVQRVRAVTLYTFCATQGSYLLQPVGCSWFTATIAASGLTHTVLWAATRLHDLHYYNA